MDAMDAAEQEGAAAGALSPSQFGAVKTLVQMCGSAKQDALGPLRKLITITDEWETILNELRREYEVSRLNPYQRNAPKPKGRKPVALGGRRNKPGHRAGRPKRKRDSECSSSEPTTLDESFSPPEDEEFGTAGGGFRPVDEHVIDGADDSDIDDDEEERQELVRKRMEEYLADIRNSTMVQLRMRRTTAAMTKAR